MVEQFLSISGTKQQTAINVLKKHKWNMDAAMDDFYGNYYQPVAEAPSTNKNKIQQVFNKYKDQSSDKIEAEGIQEICKDLGISVLDPVTLVISYYFKADRMGVWKKDEFVTGMTILDCESIQKLKGKLSSLRNELNNMSKLEEIYKFCFNFSKEYGARNLNYNLAVELWKVLLNKKTCPFIEEWINYLEIQPKKNDITKDVWNMLFEFMKITKGNLNNFEDDGAWPVLIDGFVQHLLENKS